MTTYLYATYGLNHGQEEGVKSSDIAYNGNGSTATELSNDIFLTVSLSDPTNGIGQGGPQTFISAKNVIMALERFKRYILEAGDPRFDPGEDILAVADSSSQG